MDNAIDEFMIGLADKIRKDLKGKENQLILVVEQKQYTYSKEEELIKSKMLPEPTVFVRNTYRLGDLPSKITISANKKASKGLDYEGNISIAVNYEGHLFVPHPHSEWKFVKGPIILSDIIACSNYGKILDGSDLFLPLDRKTPSPSAKSVYIVSGIEEVLKFTMDQYLPITIPLEYMINGLK